MKSEGEPLTGILVAIPLAVIFWAVILWVLMAVVAKAETLKDTITMEREIKMPKPLQRPFIMFTEEGEPLVVVRKGESQIEGDYVRVITSDEVPTNDDEPAWKLICVSFCEMDKEGWHRYETVTRSTTAK